MRKGKPLGERKMIEIVKSHLDVGPNMPVPFGDDVAAYELRDGTLVVLKTDMLVGKTDVPPEMSLRQAARKAVVMNVSDFAAKGVRPLSLLVSLGLPAGSSRKEVTEIGIGLNEAALEYGAYIVGGDTGEASDLVISVSVFGIAQKDGIMLRSGAEAGDVVAVTGLFGKPAAGLKILLNKLKPTGGRKALVDSVLTPHARLKEGLALSEAKAVTSAIDSSDGLAWSLHELSRASNVGFVIDKVPIADEVKTFAGANSLDPLELALYGGEEYELVLTIEPKHLRKAQKAAKNVGSRLFEIGKATAKRQVVLHIDGRQQLIEPRGYEHFLQRSHAPS